MINAEEIKIANKSYINKDFATIYPEQLDLIKTMTNRWDPQTSNESDPGIVLTKLNAFIADKNNYNIDKNVLENFMISATQESSMRKLCDMMGYYMNYYIAPEVDITIMYTNEDIETKGSFTLPALKTVLTSSEDDTISFVLTKSAKVLSQNSAVVVPALQGELKQLYGNNSGEITGSDANQDYIQLNNLDDNNRVYFPESNVAQNGVFISTVFNGVEGEYWRFTKNLNYEPSGSHVYKFGYDSSKGLPYVEFPEDIADLIQNGLVIRYIVTSGLDGNVRAGLIDSLASTLVDNENYSFSTSEGDIEYLFIRNLSGSINGANPESIDEAYNSFKKTIGTFDSLVTCRDYANAIYNMYDSSNTYPVVSNVQVADRRDDINYCTKVVTFDDYGEHTYNYLSDEINAFDLCCYPLKPIKSYTEEEFYSSFTPMAMYQYIKDELEEYKLASHDYKDTLDEATYLYKNYLTLNANLSTIYKVNDAERQDIITNVEKELIKRFNARNVDYGYEIPYELLVDAIMKSDKRISNVNLAEPYLTTKVMNGLGNEYDLVSSGGKDAYVNLLAKNVLSGHVPLFDYDNNFNFEFGQSKISGSDMVTYNISKIKTLASISLNYNASDFYTLQPNEFIQLLAPNLITKTTYPVYVYYYFDSGNSNIPIINNDMNYKLDMSEGESLYILYTDSNDIDHIIKYGIDSTGTYVQKDNGSLEYVDYYIQPVGLKTSSNTQGIWSANQFMTGESDKWSYNSSVATGRSGVVKNIPGLGDTLMYSLGTNETINIREKTQTILDKRTSCYWIRNNVDNKLFVEGETSSRTILLQDGEYFFYTDSTRTSFVSLGSGTTIHFPDTVSINITCDKVSLDEVIDKGILAIDDWKYLNFDSIDKQCTITENQILTLGEGDKIKLIVDGSTPSSISLNNTPTPLNGSAKIQYQLSSDAEPQYAEDLSGISDMSWSIKSRLDIDVSKGNYQQLYSNQHVYLYPWEGVWPAGQEATNPIELVAASGTSVINCFNLNAPVHLLGSEEIDVKVVEKRKDGTSYNTKFPMRAYYYSLTLQNGDVVLPIRNELNYCIIQDSELPNEFKLPKVNDSNSLSPSIKSIVFMVYVSKISGSGNVALSYDGCTLAPYNNESYSHMTQSGSSFIIDASGLYVLKATSIGDTAKITFSNSPAMVDSNSVDFSGAITLGTCDVININDFEGLNVDLGIEDFYDATESINIASDLLNVLKGKDFYYNYKPEKVKLIELDSNTQPKFNMMSPYTLYDFNNIANKFTLSEIDFSSSKIDVVRSSRL